VRRIEVFSLIVLLSIVALYQTKSTHRQTKHALCACKQQVIPVMT
jgi:hypothetical protein